MILYRIYKVVILFLILIVASSCAEQKKKYPADIEEKIKLVENSLAGWAETGNNDRWSLEERMKELNIKGVSIAVIHNYQIEWARGYGFADVSENRPVNEKDSLSGCLDK
ncbi:MAG: serine hydrolase [Bacteroidales bacterium]|nr:serine hydrolase [Bacteroidales bacterium]